MEAVEAVNISKVYGNLKALSQVSFKLNCEETLYVYGKNGAGKTTLLEMMCGFRRQTEGAVKIFGKEIPFENSYDLRDVGAVFDDSFLYGELTLYENLLFFGQLSEVDNLEARVEELLSLFNLQDKQNALVKHLSLGMEKRGAIARSMLANPKLLILDEPLSGLDKDSRKKVMRSLLEIKAGGGTIIFTSHDSDIAKEIASSILILENGTNKFFGELAEGLNLIKEN